MKLLITSDIHQYSNKWQQLVNICKINKPNIVVISGDIFPIDNQGIIGQIDFFPKLIQYADAIKEMNVKLVMITGNDDNFVLHKNLIKEDQKKWHYVVNIIRELDGFEFVGVPYVPDYPFAYKSWCRGDSKDDLQISTIQYASPIVINNNNQYEAIDDLYSYYRSNLTIQEILESLVLKVKNINKSIWLIHSPPSGYRLDICKDGRSVGSNAVRKFIEKYQPFLTIHGHIHENPEINNGIWCRKIGNTYAIQQGQMGYKLYYVLMEIDNYNIIKMYHSVYEEHDCG